MDASTEPAWIGELRALLDLRRRTLVRTALAVAALGALLALVAPSLLPATPMVGAAVGLVAALLGFAAAVAADYADDIVQGPRHVRAAGADTIATIGGPDDIPALDALAESLLAAGMPGTDGLPRRIALAPVTRDGALCADVAAELGVSLATGDLRVVVVDVTHVSGPPGLPEVVAGDCKLTDAVEYHPDLLLARLPAGEDRTAALELVPDLAARFPSDIDIALFALPALSERGVLAATEAADELLLLARPGTSRRVELLASLDAADVSGLEADVVLVDQAPPEKVPAATPAQPDAGAPAPAPDPVPEPGPAAATDPGPGPAAGGMPEAGHASEPAAAPEPASSSVVIRHPAEVEGAEPSDPPRTEATDEIPPAIPEPDHRGPREHDSSDALVDVRDDAAEIEPGGDADELYIAASIHAAARQARRRGAS